jgi:hypothetical protein
VPLGSALHRPKNPQSADSAGNYTIADGRQISAGDEREKLRSTGAAPLWMSSPGTLRRHSKQADCPCAAKGCRTEPTAGPIRPPQRASLSRLRHGFQDSGRSSCGPCCASEQGGGFIHQEVAPYFPDRREDHLYDSVRSFRCSLRRLGEYMPRRICTRYYLDRGRDWRKSDKGYGLTLVDLTRLQSSQRAAARSAAVVASATAWVSRPP